MLGWKELILLDYAYIYSLSLVIWRFLEGKLKKPRAFLLVYATGAHLVMLALCSVLGTTYLAPLILLSYFITVYFIYTNPDLCVKPYIYVFWATAFALIMLLR